MYLISAALCVVSTPPYSAPHHTHPSCSLGVTPLSIFNLHVIPCTQYLSRLHTPPYSSFSLSSWGDVLEHISSPHHPVYSVLLCTHYSAILSTPHTHPSCAPGVTCLNRPPHSTLCSVVLYPWYRSIPITSSCALGEMPSIIFNLCITPCAQYSSRPSTPPSP